MSKPTPPIKILFPIFPTYNTLDLNGPLEVFHNAALPAGTSEITVAAAQDLVYPFEGGIAKAQVLFKDLLANDAARLKEFDILCQPGAPPDAVEAVLKSNDGGGGLLEIVQRFAALGGARWLVTICTGAYFAAATGAFVGKTCTTHKGALKGMQQLANDYIAQHAQDKGKTTHVVRKRYVDGGVNEAGVRVVSSGGISCGLDCCLWVVGELLGRAQAVGVAQMMDYAWRDDAGTVVVGV